jgi:hypothetical protein
LIASRVGDVLGAHTILKEDHFPGCQSAKLPNTIPGAPNFRGVPGQNVFGSALPTVEGIKAVLTHVGAASDAHDKRKVCFHCSIQSSIRVQANVAAGLSSFSASVLNQLSDTLWSGIGIRNSNLRISLLLWGTNICDANIGSTISLQV